jgi:hypothetical protein
MRKLILALLFTLSVCDVEPVLATEDPAPTADDVLGVMSRLRPEACLYNRAAAGCDRPGRYDKGPDARRIAEGIAAAADGSLTGTRQQDAALMATFTSYESGNVATAVGDGGRAHGAFQLHYVPEQVAFDPLRAAPIWRSIARETMTSAVCKDNPPDERLAGVAGSCSYAKARRKVRQRMQAARDALSAR